MGTRARLLARSRSLSLKRVQSLGAYWQSTRSRQRIAPFSIDRTRPHFSMSIEDGDQALRARVREIISQVLTEQSVGKPAVGTVAVGADHGGLELKQNLVPFLTQLGYAITDC